MISLLQEPHLMLEGESTSDKGIAVRVSQCAGEDATSSTQLQYDTIVDTFGLCSFEKPELVLNALIKSVKPGGQVGTS